MMASIGITMIAVGLCLLLVVLFYAAEELRLRRREKELQRRLWCSGGIVKGHPHRKELN